MKATIGKTQLQTSSGLTFIHPAYTGTHTECMQQIRSAGEQPPIYSQVTDMVYEAVIKDPNNQYSKEIRQIMRSSWLRADTGLLYLPDGRAYVQDRPILGSDGLPKMEESELEAKLQANDPSVRFVEPGFNTGEQTVFELAKNPYVIALASEQGAEQLAEIASTYKNKPVVFSLEDVSEPTTRVSALGVCDWELDFRLDVVGDDHGDYRYGHAFVVRIAEGDAQKI
ncbi:hypothetical protein J4438_00740 [Candidatus Woesearchaeota archaeon]|nr:hypothetical protein [Candidatus Woesearchaeota archaeon]